MYEMKKMVSTQYKVCSFQQFCFDFSQESTKNNNKPILEPQLDHLNETEEEIRVITERVTVAEVSFLKKRVRRQA